MAKKENKKYLNFEIMLMDVKVLKKELSKELKKEKPDKKYIEEIINYGSWDNSINRLNKSSTTIKKAFELLHGKKKMTLHFIVKKSYLSLIKPMLNPILKNPNIQNWNDYTEIIEALNKNDLSKVMYILEYPNVQGYEGNTPLHEACYNKNLKKVQELLKHPLIDLSILNEYGAPALHVACCHINIVKEILKHPLIDPNIQNPEGPTALQWVASDGDLQVVRELLKHPLIDPNIGFYWGDTNLTIALRGGHLQIFREILNHPKTYLNAKDVRELISIASERGYSQVVEEILNHPKAQNKIDC